MAVPDLFIPWTNLYLDIQNAIWRLLALNKKRRLLLGEFTVYFLGERDSSRGVRPRNPFLGKWTRVFDEQDQCWYRAQVFEAKKTGFKMKYEDDESIFITLEETKRDKFQFEGNPIVMSLLCIYV